MNFIKSGLTLFILLFFCALTTLGQSQRSYQTTTRILSEMNSRIVNRDKLARLFRVGDERIGDLIKALYDPNPNISLRAQTIIRYLGNNAGMKGLIEWYAKQKQFAVAGPIPLPLTEWDYKVIYGSYLNEIPEKWERSESYIYALALDDSPKAKEALETILRIASELDEATAANHAARRVQGSQPAKVLAGNGGVAKLVLANAFFVAANDRKYTSARLLALNRAKDKALVEVHINRGRLAEEWYHVVTQKREHGWQFFSITPIAVS